MDAIEKMMATRKRDKNLDRSTNLYDECANVIANTSKIIECMSPVKKSIKPI